MLSSSGFSHGLAGPLMPQHAILPCWLHPDFCFSHTVQTRGLLQKHTRHPFPDISAARPEGCPVLLALSKEAGFSGTESVKEGGCRRRGISKRSGPMSGHVVPDFRRHWVYRAVISWTMFYRCTHSVAPAQDRLNRCFCI